ncbi:MAG: hypothetical protein V8T01_10015 [Oscillospiraceae bacterium]
MENGCARWRWWGSLASASSRRRLVLVYLANLLVTKHGWGTWITIVAILLGLLCAASSAWNLIRSIHKKEPKPPEKPGVHFRDHI